MNRDRRDDLTQRDTPCSGVRAGLCVLSAITRFELEACGSTRATATTVDALVNESQV